jgi:hypothetical protein
LKCRCCWLAAQLLVHVPKQCGDDLTRENVLKQAAYRTNGVTASWEKLGAIITEGEGVSRRRSATGLAPHRIGRGD